MLHGLVSSAAAVVVSAGLLAVPASSPVTAPATSPATGPTTRQAAATSAPVARRACGPEPTSAAGWQHLWDAQTGAWSGGDGASSTRLPDGRLLWLFGDTYVGAVDRSGHRSPGTRMVRNSIVVTDGSCVDVVATTSDALPGRGGTWLWPTHAVVESAGHGTVSRLVVLAQRLTRTGPGDWGFRRTGTASIPLSVPWLGVPSVGTVRDLPTSTVLWGAAVLTEGSTTWVYGTREVERPWVFGRDLLLARAPTATVDDPSTWSYRTASGWSRDAARAAVVRPAGEGVSTVASVARVGSSYVVVTKPQEFLGADVDALTAPDPWGPWTENRLFRATSTADEPRYSPCVVARSGPGRRVVVVVSRTTTSLALLARDAWRTRPTFTDVTLPG